MENNNKKILGLDLGTNSIGWALINQNTETQKKEIIKLGARIIPMSEDILGKFDSGVTESDTAARTGFRGVRRLRERHLLRRERLHRVLNILNFLPEHYTKQIDFEKRLGQYVKESEPKIAYRYNEELKTFEFVYKKAFNEMVDDFKKFQPELFENGKKIPFDWTIYYLRKKALTQKIDKEELAWLLLNFNQKRGYFQLRGEEEEEKSNKLVEFHSLKIVDVVDSGDRKGKEEIWYNVHLENGWIYRRTSKVPLDWVGKTKDFIVTTDLNEDGSIKKDKDGKEKRSFRAPAEGDWTLEKKRKEFLIGQSGKTVGVYIYDTLLQNPKQKINGSLVRVIERKFYKGELKQILECQQNHHPELKNKVLYKKCLEELYKHNEAHRNSNEEKDFVNLFLNDIIFYQRPLKSKKSLISDCKFESRPIKDKDGKLKKNIDGTQVMKPIKCIAKSHPYFQEFRLWQWLKNLSIHEKVTDIDVTDKFLSTEEEWISLFEWLNNRKDVDHKALLTFLCKPLKLKASNFRWNYVYDASKDESKKYPCNRTRNVIISKLGEEKCKAFLTQENEIKIWELLYSINTKEETEKALSENISRELKKEGSANQSIYSLLITNGFDKDEIEALQKANLDEKDYGSFSAKAIKKLLPLMRMGKYWDEANIHPQTKLRIEKIINAEYDNSIKDRVRTKAINLTSINDFKGLPLWLTSYIVYDRHSEEGEIKKWKSIQDLENYLEEFKQHSLRNPIVEQVITETLRVVKDIWKIHGNGAENFFDEIHIELGREMKNPADIRNEMTRRNTENENTNLRIKSLLAEMMNDHSIENVRPHSPSQQEILRIYEDGVINSGIDIEDDILKISKTAQPSKSDLVRYKLWLEQKYRSPYTGVVIPLSKLFTPAYEIEHIIPQSRHFDDSFTNKVICEAEVNKLKDNKLGLEFIKANYGQIVPTAFGKSVTIFTVEAYEKFVKDYYANSRGKMKKLLLEEVPEQMIERQMNDTRYISKVVKNLLSNIVRAENNDDGTTSINVLSSNGQITSMLKQDWGLNDVWNEIIAPRFERLNAMTNSNNFGAINEKTGKFLPTVPLELSKGFTKKRIDHRHHALDALVIACVTRNHINYLNNQNALEKNKSKEEKQQKREDLRTILCLKKYNEGSEKNYKWTFKKPWESFTQEAKEQLLTTLVCFKQNLRVINKTVNKYERWKENNGVFEKVIEKQTKGESWAIRKPMHKDTVSGKVELRRIKVPKGKILTATRKFLDASFDLKTIESITDTGIQKILKNYLKAKGDNAELAFSAEGIEDLNQNIEIYNDGKSHQPITKVRVFELGSKFQIGQNGNKKDKYVEAAKGTNLFFAIYQDANGKRSYDSIPFNEVVESQKLSAGSKEKPMSVPLKNEKGDSLLFDLSPNDLVFMPNEEEKENPSVVNFNNFKKEQLQRIYKIVSFTGNRLYGIQFNVSKSIYEKTEYTQLNKMETSIEKASLKEYCWKLQVNRVGQITKIIR